LRSMGRREMLRSLACVAAVGLTDCARRDRRARLDPLAENDTTDAARDRVAGRFSALVHVDRTRLLLARADTSGLFAWSPLLLRTGVDPLRDVRRAYVTAKSFESPETAMVLELEPTESPEQRMSELLATLAERGDEAGPVPGDGRVRTKASGDPYVVGSPMPNTLVALPAPEDGPVPSFAGLGTLPEPHGAEAIEIFAKAPCETLTSLLDWPQTLLDVRAEVTLSAEAARITVIGRSTSTDQAIRDADALTERVNDRLGVDLVLFRVPLLDDLRFVARGTAVELVTSVSAAQVGLLLALSEW
jgi:hypothetical protein